MNTFNRLADQSGDWSSWALSSVRDMAAQLIRLTRKVDRLQNELAEKDVEIRKLWLQANTDELTGLYNRHFLNENFCANDDNRRKTSGVQILFIDLDGFKKINDTLGHDAGDAGLRAVANLLKSNVRQDDHIIRFGGDEFVVLLSGADWAGAQNKAHQIQHLLDSHTFKWNGSDCALSGSVGCHRIDDDKRGVAEEIHLADMKMYMEKKRRKEGYSGPSAMAS